MTAPVIDIRRADDRYKTKIDWLDSKHSFSFSHHYDPANTHHGVLLVNNDDIVRPGTGFDTHPHRDMEIVTWVLRGSLVHQDSTGHSGVIYPGLAQRMSAGRILHSEKNDGWKLTGHESHSEPVHFVQMWVVPDESGIDPGYQQLEIDDELLKGGLVTIASGMPEHKGETAINIRNKYAALKGARLQPGQSIELPEAPYLHLFVPRGEVALEGAGELREGDAVRFTASGGQKVTAIEPAEILVWEMHAGLAAYVDAAGGERPARRMQREPFCSGSVFAPASGRVPSGATGRGLSAVTVDVPPGLAQAPFDQPRQVLIPAGWTMSVWVRTPKPRLVAVAPDGTLLVSVPATGQVLRITRSGDSAVLLDGLEQPHGLAFAGATLYVAQSNQITAYDYADGLASAERVVAGGLPDAKSPDLHGAYAHALKSVAVGRDGAVFFSIGSTGNISAADRDATPPRATIMRVPPGGGPAAVFAAGVRNGTGLAVAPDGTVWTAVNNRDNVADPDGRVSTGYVNDHPPESVARLTPGRELGWPYCNPDGGPANLPFIRDMQTNADGSRLDCAALPPVEQSLGAHSAPLGMSFTELPQPYGAGALIGVHGSWNRTPPQAPEVSFFAWHDGTLGDQQTLVGGFQLPDGSRWGRPVAAVLGSDGAVYITDDYADAIYRLAPPNR